MNIALGLTLSRIFLSPVFLVIYLYHVQLGISFIVLPFILIGLVVLAELTDLFDGLAARKRGEVTELGKLLDPMADSIFRLSVFLALTQGVINLPLWLVLFFFYRDSVISLLRTVCALRGFTLAARFSGKVKAVVQACSALVILVLMIPYAFGFLSLAVLQSTSFYIVLGAVVYSLFSGAEYLKANQSYIKKALVK
ncbi:MAG: putative CDP-diacylglycerol--glycerol-3-phosphate 3-phosphatidyl-transferase 2 [Chlamydiae bacterium]|nr:putative CDP-diacylglycerol--glycerol-3-phosphate 3-phosphatidyl-transferase 2 [Chlamydiota bacterium]